MASFIAKQLVGKQLDSVKGAIGKDEDKDEAAEGAKEIDPELQEALREAEEKRQEKHRKMEEERETMRQEIRDKYGLKKKEEEIPWDPNSAPQEPSGRLGRTRKTPEELRAEANAEEEEEDGITSFLPENMREMANKVTEGPAKLVAEASEKCTIQ